MISALNGMGALSLLTMFGRSQSVSGSGPPSAASRPPPPPPSQGNGASAQSVFEALVSGSDGLSSLIAGADQDADGALNSDELTAAFTKAGGEGDGLSEMVSDILSNLDADGSSSINAEELAAGLQSLAANGPPPAGPAPDEASTQAQSLISALDSNGDGQLSAEKLTAAFGAADTSSAEAEAQKSIQELLFNLILDQKDQSTTGQTALAGALYGG